MSEQCVGNRKIRSQRHRRILDLRLKLRAKGERKTAARVYRDFLLGRIDASRAPRALCSGDPLR